MQFKSEAWYQFLDEGMADLVKQAYSLLDKFKVPEYHDYSFIVFPMAKAYEGFLKNGFSPAVSLTNISTKATILELARP